MISNDILYDILKISDQNTLKKFYKISFLESLITSQHKIRFRFLYEDSLQTAFTIFQCNKMAEYGDIKCLKYAKKLGYKWSAHTAAEAIKYGHLKCLKYLYEHNCPYDIILLITAVDFQQLECLEYLYDMGCEFNWLISNEATKIGNLNILKFLINKNIIFWSDTLFINVARNGHIECLKYLYENNCPTSVFAYAYAIKNGHLDCAKYLYKKNIKCDVQKNNVHPNCKSFIIKKRLIYKMKNIYKFVCKFVKN
jgi:hypothetical protein